METNLLMFTSSYNTRRFAALAETNFHFRGPRQF